MHGANSPAGVGAKVLCCITPVAAGRLLLRCRPAEQATLAAAAVVEALPLRQEGANGGLLCRCNERQQQQQMWSAAGALVVSRSSCYGMLIALKHKGDKTSPSTSTSATKQSKQTSNWTICRHVVDVSNVQCAVDAHVQCAVDKAPTCVHCAVVGHGTLCVVLPPGARLGTPHGVIINRGQADQRRPEQQQQKAQKAGQQTAVRRNC
jgi:hypothetical protein